jgi:DNA-directed RNA polymerase subunit L
MSSSKKEVMVNNFKDVPINDPEIHNLRNDKNKLTFVLNNVDTSVANALRRVILSDIEIIVIISSPYEKNQVTINKNTTRLNNEIIKQRLSSIPIHITDIKSFSINDYILEINSTNETNTTQYITSEHFNIRNIHNNSYLSKDEVNKIFPPNKLTNHYVDLVRLRPKVSEEIPGETLELTAKFSTGTAGLDGMFNVVSTCSYGFTPDEGKQTEEWTKLEKTYKDDGLSSDDIELKKHNWKTLDSKKHYIPNSFNFIIESIGIFTNKSIFNKACNIIIDKLNVIEDNIDKNSLIVNKSDTTMDNCYDIILENEDYTIGYLIEYMFYTQFYNGNKNINFCGFKKLHPHDNFSIIRVSFKDDVESSECNMILKHAIHKLKSLFTKIDKLI